MRYYIGTVWFLTAASEAVDGDAGIIRLIIRRQAENEEDFKTYIEDQELRHHVDNQVWFGPISLSKEQ